MTFRPAADNSTRLGFHLREGACRNFESAGQCRHDRDSIEEAGRFHSVSGSFRRDKMPRARAPVE